MYTKKINIIFIPPTVPLPCKMLEGRRRRLRALAVLALTKAALSLTKAAHSLHSFDFTARSLASFANTKLYGDLRAVWGKE